MIFKAILNFLLGNEMLNSTQIISIQPIKYHQASPAGVAQCVRVVLRTDTLLV